MDRGTGSGLSFAKRIYLPRSIGLGIGFFCVAAGLWPLYSTPWLWALLVFNGFLWPHLAYQLARRSAAPYQAERRNLLIDSVFGGFWAAAMQFNVLPSVTILAMMAMNNIAAGGGRFFARGCVAMLLGAGLAMLLFGPALAPDTSMPQLYACLPMLILYPLALGSVSYRLSIKLAEHKQALRAASRTDSLTRLYNHGYWKDLLQETFNQCRGGQQRATVALIDVDNFKQINDQHGHQAGDQVLIDYVKLIKACSRQEDRLFRFGGEEFLLLLPDVDLQGLEAAAQHLLVAVREQLSGPGGAVTVSIGGAMLRNDEPWGQWLQRADQCLYRAKSSGRNCIIIDRPTGDLAPSH